MTIQLNPTVGVAPGTTTLALGGLSAHNLGASASVDPYGEANCPPDEPWQYVTPPQITEGMPPGVAATVTQAPTPHYWDPYTDEAALNGLRGPGLGSFTSDLGNASWGLVLFAGVAVFGVAFLGMYIKSWRDKHKRG